MVTYFVNDRFWLVRMSGLLFVIGYIVSPLLLVRISPTALITVSNVALLLPEVLYIIRESLPETVFLPQGSHLSKAFTTVDTRF